MCCLLDMGAKSLEAKVELRLKKFIHILKFMILDIFLFFAYLYKKSFQNNNQSEANKKAGETQLNKKKDKEISKNTLRKEFCKFASNI